MGDPKHDRFDQTQRETVETRYGFVRNKLLPLQRDQTRTQPIPSLGNRFPGIGLNFCGQYQLIAVPSQLSIIPSCKRQQAEGKRQKRKLAARRKLSRARTRDLAETVESKVRNRTQFATEPSSQQNPVRNRTQFATEAEGKRQEVIGNKSNDRKSVRLGFEKGYSHHTIKRLTPDQLGVKNIENRKFPSVKITLLSDQFVSLLSHNKYLLRPFPNRISLRQYVLVAGDTS